MKWSRLLLVILFAALAFGGSFTCAYHSGDGDTVVVHNN
jgi:hypothetical protein